MYVFAAVLKEVFGHPKWRRIFSIRQLLYLEKIQQVTCFSKWSEVSDACPVTQYQTSDGALFAKICRVMRFVYRDLTDDVFVTGVRSYNE